MKATFSYSIDQLMPYINWVYFYHAWQLGQAGDEEKAAIRAEAEALGHKLNGKYRISAAIGLFDAVSQGDDIIIDGTCLPTLRQQRIDEQVGATLSMADFISPASGGKTDRIGVFATAVDASLEHYGNDDIYTKMLVQTLADRLAEAAAEVLHLEVRTKLWGYAKEESLAISDLHAERFQGIRPAIGYPSLPDTSLNFILSQLIPMEEIGIRLTESGMMMPHASVSGLMIAHPAARYFDVGRISEDQLSDYARRRGLPTEYMRRFLQSNLTRK